MTPYCQEEDCFRYALNGTNYCDSHLSKDPRSENGYSVIYTGVGKSTVEFDEPKNNSNYLIGVEHNVIEGKGIVTRIDKYTLSVDGHYIYANDEQEKRIRALTPEQRQRFIQIMGKGGDDGDDDEDSAVRCAMCEAGQLHPTTTCPVWIAEQTKRKNEEQAKAALLANRLANKKNLGAIYTPPRPDYSHIETMIQNRITDQMREEAVKRFTQGMVLPKHLIQGTWPVD